MTNGPRLKELEELIASLTLDDASSEKWRLALGGLWTMDAAGALKAEEVADVLEELRQSGSDTEAVARRAQVMAHDVQSIEELK